MAEQFEAVLFEGGHRFDRLKVPGGWIYRDSRIGAMVFVPFPPLSLSDLVERGGFPDNG